MKRLSSTENTLIGTLALLLVLFLAVMFWDNPTWAFRRFGTCDKFEILKFLGISMGGVLFVLQVVASHRRAKAMEKSATAQAKATEQHARANQNTEQGQRQERLKNAIEHLGHTSASVRLGGAYELFHLAEDTRELRQSVFDILCAHIRRTTSEDKYRKKHKGNPSEEVQSLLTLLFVQDHTVFKGLHIDLHGSWLNGANLPGARLEKVELTRAHLRRAILRKARLHGAILDKAQLHGADLIEAYLQETSLRSAQLQMVMLDGAQLQAANLAGARLRGADLSWAYMHRAIFFDMEAGNAELQGGILRNTELHEADLRQARLQGVGYKLLPDETFAQRIRRSIGRENDLSLAIFGGGLHSDQDMDSRVRGLSDETANTLREELQQHIGKPRSHQLPEDAYAITGSYTKEEAEQWIAEYEEAMSEVPEEDS